MHAFPRRLVFASILAGSLLLLALLPTRSAAPASRGAAENLRLGTVDFPTSGAAAAQPHFLRGVAALHSFWYEEALEAFAAALAVDPQFAMARWGEAMCYYRPYRTGHDADAGRRALAKIADTSALTPRERAYIDALRVFYGKSGGGDRKAYAEAMAKVQRDLPDDREAAAFYALALLADRGRGGMANQEKAGALAQEVYRHNPNHPGAAHYIIHSYDDPAHASRALHAANHYAKIAPDAPHALHMPSHIYVQLGMWHEAASSNDLGWAASVNYVDRRKIAPTLRDYHNLHWLIYASLQQGRYAKAQQLVEQFVAWRGDIAASGNRYYDSALAAYIVETRRWDQADALFAQRPGRATADATKKNAAATTAGAAAREVEICGGGDAPAPKANVTVTSAAAGSGSGSNSLGDTPRFIRALAAAGRGEKPDPAVTDAAAATKGRPNVRALQVTALAHAQAGAFQRAIADAREAADTEGGTPKPPGPPTFKPAHELLGEILLQAGQPKDALAAFKTALDRHPNRALSLLGRARAEAAAGDAKAARTTYAKLLDVWQHADRDLPELREAQTFVAARG